MKILIWSDHQFHPWKEFSVVLPNGRNSRFQDQLNVLDEIFKAAVDNSCQMIIHDGDLFDILGERIDKRTFLDVYGKFVEFSNNDIVVILNVGNHDWIDRTETHHIIEPFREIKNMVVVDKPRKEQIDDVELIFIPFTRQDFPSEISSLFSDKNQVFHSKKYLFTHQGISGAVTGPRDVMLKDELALSQFLPNFWTLIFNGHYHKHQILGTNFHIVGSPLQKDFGERNDVKGYFILDTEKAPATPVFYETSSPKFHKILAVKGEFKEDNGNKIIKNENDFYWVVADSDEYNVSSELGLTKNIRYEVVEEKELKPRTEIKMELSIPEQLLIYIENMNKNDSSLIKDRLLNLGKNYYQGAVT